MKSLKRELLETLLIKLHLYDSFFYLLGKRYEDQYVSLRAVKKIFLLMTPSYGNLGDQAIEIATCKYLEDYFNEYQIVKVHLEDTYLRMKAIKKSIQKDDLVMLQGGGNFGSLYLSVEDARRFIVRHLKNNPVISLPCSVTYTDSKAGKKELKKSQKIYCKHRDLTLISRDSFSYEYCLDHFKGCKNILNPDMVFYLWNHKGSKERREILICIRRDGESILGSRQAALINQLFDEYEDACIIDTRVERTISDEIKMNEVKSVINQFSRAKVVITDRLHGLILSAITNTPCIVMPSLDQKIVGTYQWIKEMNRVIFLKQAEYQEIKKSIEVLNKRMEENIVRNPFEKKFEVLKKNILQQNK